MTTEHSPDETPTGEPACPECGSPGNGRAFQCYSSIWTSPEGRQYAEHTEACGIIKALRREAHGADLLNREHLKTIVELRSELAEVRAERDEARKLIGEMATVIKDYADPEETICDCWRCGYGEPYGPCGYDDRARAEIRDVLKRAGEHRMGEQ